MQERGIIFQPPYMDLILGIFMFCRGAGAPQTWGGGAVNFTVERTPVGFRALELLA